MNKDLKILLIDPGFFPTHKREGFLTKYADLDSQIQTKPPLGILSVASYIYENGFRNIRIVDVEREVIDSTALLSILNEFQPDVVGVSLYTYRLKNAFTLINEVKQWKPSVYVCIGGPHTLSFSKQALNIKGVDSIVVGDGETPFLSLCEGIASGNATPDAPGIYYASKMGSYEKFERNTERDMDILPFPNPNLIDDFKNKYKNFMNNQYTMTLVTSKGCPYHCNFCIAPSIPFRAMSTERLVEAMRYYTSLGFKDVDFYDDTFNANLKKLERFAQKVIDEGLKFTWSVRGAKVLNMSIPFLKLMKQAGLKRMQFGVESGSNRVLEVLNKDLTIEETIACFDNINAVGIESIANIMLFCPTETFEETLATVKLIHRIKPTFISVQVFMLFPPMEWYHKKVKDGLLAQSLWNEYITNPVGDTPFFTVKGAENADDLFKFRDKVVSEYYLKPAYILKRLVNMNPNEIGFHFRMGWLFLKRYLNLA